MPRNPAAQLDTQDMFSVLYSFPEQVRQAIEIGEQAPIFRQAPVSNRIAIFGLGGSAIGGDLLRSFLASTDWGEHLDISVHRSYTAPKWINGDTNIIVSSYSGETEETLSAFDQVRKRTMRALAITTGGTLQQKAVTWGVPVINIPPGFQPRCALAFSFFPLLVALGRSGMIDAHGVRMNSRGVNELIRELEAVRDTYASKAAKNPALVLAKKLHGTYPVIYSASERMEAVNLRWRGQIQENAKQVAFGNVLPEMNHNEINGWQFPKGKTKPFEVILLRDNDDHDRTKIRFDALQSIIKGSVGGVTTVEGSGKSLLARMFTAIYLGDWTSYHLALLNGVDPSPVPVIQKLKSTLAKAR